MRWVLFLCYTMFMKRVIEEDEWEDIAKDLVKVAHTKRNQTGATVIALSGTLGAGKTTLTKSIATVLGVRSRVSSPTFIVMKFFTLPKNASWKQLIHIDAYRLEKSAELRTLGWEMYARDKNNLIVVEWPEKIKELLPKHFISVKLAYAGNRRSISF